MPEPEKLLPKTLDVQVDYAGPACALPSPAIDDQVRLLDLGESLFGTILEAVDDGINVNDTEGRYVVVNSAMARRARCPIQEIIGKTPFDLYEPSQAKRIMDQYRSVLQTGEALDDEMEFPDRDYARLTHVHRVPLRDESGRIVGVVSTSRDITQRKIAEAEREQFLIELTKKNLELATRNEELQTLAEELRSQREDLEIQAQQLAASGLEREQLLEEVERKAAELDVIIRSIPAGIIVYDSGGEISRMNESAHRLLGFGPEEMRLPLSERTKLIQYEDGEGKPIPLGDAPGLRATRGEAVSDAVVVAHRRDRTSSWLTASAAPIRTPDGEQIGAVASFVDVSEMHRLHEQLRDLVRAIGHDLRTPLTAVLGQAQVLQRAIKQGAAGARVESGLAAIVVGAKRMQAMTEDLADSARLESGGLVLRKQPIHLESFVCDMLERASLILQANRVKVEIPHDLPTIEADPDRLERILTNLVSNALKYSPAETQVVLGARETEGEVSISIEDRGPGVAPEEKERLFDKFYRSDQTRRMEGLGLGLYITRALVEAHGGRIWVESEAGAGSTFVFTIPGMK